MPVRPESANREAVELIRRLQNEPHAEPSSALRELAERAVDAVPGAEYAGITVIGPKGTVESVAATHPYARLLDDIQHTHRQGPCVTAAWEQHTMHVSDLAADDRWPDYRREVIDRTPIRSILSFELFTAKKKLRALNYYSESANAFDGNSIEVGLVYATHMAIAWNILMRDAQFRSALASRDIIGQAKGIIMERFDVDAGHAFDLLTRLSQSSNIPLVEVAERLVTTKVLDGGHDEGRRRPK
ncbi:GAF and ANTAR domain-containing protein [Mycobacterium sp. NPDC051804]|uniref:GAF and ANTAR domain-containing protein n=1 Tax=Mycobacterium sp. NPDC051804 TaxID=3364295 RepID=UPI0037B18478